MSIIVVLIIISMAVATVFLIAFFWSVKSGQYEDTYTPSVRMLFDDKTEDLDLPSASKVKEENSAKGQKNGKDVV